MLESIRKFREVVSSPGQEVGKLARFIIFQVRLWPQCVKLLRKNRAGQQAAALSYHTIFGLVPTAIIMLMIFQSLHAFDNAGAELKDIIYTHTNIKNIEYPQDSNDTTGSKVTIAEKIDEITVGFYDKLNKGSITAVSVMIILWAAIALLSTIERSFNSIWRVSRGRNFVHRVINYWSLLTLTPLLLGFGMFLRTKYGFGKEIESSIMPYIGPALPYLVSVVMLFLLYVLMPNAKVNIKAALWGAIIAAVVWTFAKWAFGLYVTKLIPYSAIYGVMGLIPLGVFWIYITWLIVLFGLQITFTTQHLKTIEEAEKAAAKNNEEHFLITDFHVMDMVNFIYANFEKKNSPLAAEFVSSSLNLPADFTEKMLSHLVKSGVLLKTTEPALGFSPATTAENVTLAEVAEAVAQASFERPGDETETIRQIVAEQRQKFSQISVKDALRD
ncbi:MAG: YihY/virulence factor BrkB family protein [Anaerohalosphaeraceae bacterium]|nr:YihY/virulence factor BrkB family protein [Anaerohalosphaeraceae bacterium]